MNPDDEILDLVDSTDVVIGTVNRLEYDYTSTEKGYLRAVGVFIVNQDGKLWIPIRNADKKISPNGYDFSAGEHVKSGESYEEATVRGLKEELNIIIDKTQLKLLGSLKPESELPYFHKIFVIRQDEAPQYNKNDYSSFQWLSKTVLSERITAGKPAKDALRQSLELLDKL